MFELSDEDIKNYKEWSEGNKYLFDLFCSCKKNGITTFASCGGHNLIECSEENIDSIPYIGINIDSNTLPFIKDIISELKDMSNIQMEAGFAKFANGRSFTITATPLNCCEVFYRINSAINRTEKVLGSDSNKNILKSIYRTIKAKQLYNSAKKICNYSEEEIQKIITNKSTEYKFDTFTKDFVEYHTHSSTIRSLLDESNIDPHYEKLYNKYGHLQKEYSPNVNEKPIALLEQSNKSPKNEYKESLKFEPKPLVKSEIESIENIENKKVKNVKNDGTERCG